MLILNFFSNHVEAKEVILQYKHHRHVASIYVVKLL